MKLGRNSLGGSLQAGGEYDWIEDFRKRGRAPEASIPDDDVSTGIAVEDDLLRTVIFTILLGGFAALGGYFSYRAASGSGFNVLAAGACLAALLACGAVVSRRRWWLRSLLVLASLGVAALLVDQVVYYRWHERMDRVVTSLRQDIASGPPAIPSRMSVRPTSIWIDPDQEVFLTFEPPSLAWMYRLDTSSAPGHALVAGWYRVLSRVTRGRRLDRVTRTMVRPHQVYSVSVRSGEKTLSCQNSETGGWTVSIETRPGTRPLQAAPAQVAAGT
jgi:hypothetical protein